MMEVMSALGLMSDDQSLVEGMLSSVDADRDGLVDFEEFVLMMCKRILEEDGKAELDQAFRMLSDSEQFDAGPFVDADDALAGKEYCTVAEVRRLLTSAGTRPFNDDEMDEFIREAHAETIDGVECISLARFRAMECWHLPQLPVVLETRKQASRRTLQSLPLDLPLGEAEGSPEVTGTGADLAAEQSHTLASLSEPLATPKKPGNSPRQTL